MAKQIRHQHTGWNGFGVYERLGNGDWMMMRDSFASTREHAEDNARTYAQAYPYTTFRVFEACQQVSGSSELFRCGSSDE